MKNLTKILILLIASLSYSVFFAQTANNRIISNTDTLTLNGLNNSLITDTTRQDTLDVKSRIDSAKVKDISLYKSILYRDTIHYNLNKPYNKEVFKFKYDSFKEKMKDPWIGDILKEIFFR